MVNQKEITFYWENEVCGTRHSTKKKLFNYYDEIKKKRYKYETFIPKFLGFKNKDYFKDKLILEIGVGAGTDFVQFLKTGAKCYGIDATQSSIDETENNIKYSLSNFDYKLHYLGKHNAEKLPFESNSFDLVYSYGALHHAENTMLCISEAIRVLKPGGNLKLMVYSNFSSSGIMLWFLYGLLRGKPFLSQEEIIFKYLESPGTKSYSKKEFRKILDGFGLKDLSISKFAGCGDKLLMPPSNKYKNSLFFKFIKKIFPRFLVSKFENILGLALTVNAYK